MWHLVWAPEAAGPAETPSSVGRGAGLGRGLVVGGICLPMQTPAVGRPVGEAQVLSGVCTSDPRLSSILSNLLKKLM